MPIPPTLDDGLIRVPAGASTLSGFREWAISDEFPRRGRIDVTIRPPLQPGGADWADALVLRNAARREISVWCGEPDLVEAEGRAWNGAAED